MFGSEITEEDWKNHQRVKNSTHSVTVYTLCTVVGFHSHINCILKGAVRTDQFLKLSVGHLWRHKSLQKQVELQIHKKLKLAVSREAVPLNCSNKATHGKCLQMVTVSLCY